MKRQTSIAAFFSPSSSSPKKPRIEAAAAAVVDEEPVPEYSKPHPYQLPPTADYNHPIPIASPNLDLVYNSTPRLIKTPVDLDLMYFDRFIDPSTSHKLFDHLLQALPWYRVNYTVRNIDIKTPRYTTVFGKDPVTPWSDAKKPRAIPPVLMSLKQKVEEVTGAQYNFCLVNYYADGRDSISFHSDGERFLGPNPCIASLSLAAGRDFQLRHVDYKANGLAVQKFKLHDGDMVVMRGTTQHKWQHSIPKRAKADGRVNITFRKGITAYSTQNYLTYNVGSGPIYRWREGKMVTV